MKVQRVSLESIAKAAGVHKATVSRSLRNHPTIPPETRERIQKIAKEMGYRPNPLVSMFQSQARASRPHRLQAALGWINDYPNASCWNDFPWLRGYLNGARERCEAMGYRLQQIDLGEGANNPEDEVKAASRILLQQSIYGVVLPLVLNTAYLETRWENCVISVIGGGHREESGNHTEFPSLIYPQGFPSADRDLYYNSRLAFRNLRKLDYSRIGLVYSKYLDNEAHGRTRAGFLIEQNTQSPESHVPVLMLERFKEGRPLEFDEWFEKHKPDAIMCVNPVIRTWVESMGLSVPKDVGLVNLNIVDDVSEWSGVNENHDAIGAAAVDLILSALSRNELGMNPQPRKILVPGTWLEGTTLRAPANL